MHPTSYQSNDFLHRILPVHAHWPALFNAFCDMTKSVNCGAHGPHAVLPFIFVDIGLVIVYEIVELLLYMIDLRQLYSG